jgi:hypothetical protein
MATPEGRPSAAGSRENDDCRVPARSANAGQRPSVPQAERFAALSVNSALTHPLRTTGIPEVKGARNTIGP